MSITLKVNVSFLMTLVVPTETVKGLEAAREEARKIPQEKVDTLKGETKFRLELFTSDRSTGEVLELIYRAGIREFMRGDFLKEITGDESTGRLGSVKVVFDRPARSCTCGPHQGCTQCPPKVEA